MSKINKIKNIWKEYGMMNAVKLAILNLLRLDAKYIDVACGILSQESNGRIHCVDDEKTKNPHPIVWSFWWQGVEALPEVLKVTYESHKKHIANLGYNYVFVDKNNLYSYLDIPDYILDKVNKGIISFTHFSDYIRIALLEKYGGAWIDITLLMVNDLPKDIFDYAFYSFNLHESNHKPEGLGQIITDCRWAGFMLSTNEKHNPFFRYVKDSLEFFWKNHNYVLDYFLMNLIIRTAYENNSYIRHLIDSIPQNNLHLYDLAKLVNAPFDEYSLSEIEKDEVFFKVTQKIPMINEINGSATFYAYYKSLYFWGGEV